MTKGNRNFRQNNIPASSTADQKWWQKTVKALGVEVPVMMFMGVLVGILLAFAFVLSKPELLLHPLIDNSVQATLAAQPTPPNVAQDIQSTATAFGMTQTAFSNLPTQTAVVQTAVSNQSASANPEVLSIDDIPLTASVYVFDAPDPDRSTELQVVYGDNLGKGYKQIFSFPDNPKSGAAMTFRFKEPVNLSVFQNIEFTILFDTEINKCELYLADLFGNFESVFCKEPFPSDDVDITVEIDNKGRRFTTIPLSANFDKVNLKFVSSMYFVINPGKTEGQIIYEVYNIKFTK